MKTGAAWTSTARDMVADPTREGWAALALCIIRGVGIETAFNLLTDHRASTRPQRLSEQDYKDIEALRAQGCSWREIGYMYGREKTAMHHAYDRNIKKKREVRK